MVGEKGKNIILEIYRDSRTVFRINDIAMLIGERKTASLSKRLNYLCTERKIAQST
ncbi:MAG: hypothetical protein WCS39_08095 [Bacteroidales bacterium]|jgi:hypothetical protein